MAIDEHFPDHVPSDGDVPTLDEVAGDVHVVLVNGDLESELVQFLAVERVVTRQSEVALHISEDYLHVCRGQRQVIRHRQDYLVHVLIVVANTPVEVQQCLVWVFLQLGRQCLHFLVA